MNKQAQRTPDPLPLIEKIVGCCSGDRHQHEVSYSLNGAAYIYMTPLRTARNSDAELIVTFQKGFGRLGFVDSIKGLAECLTV